MYDLKKLDAEIEALRHELSVVIPEEIRTATELGDLRENSEFSAAVFRQHYTSVRLKQLLDRRKFHMSYNIDNIPKDRIGVGSLVKVRHKQSNKIMKFRLVPSETADADGDVEEITVNSPVGKAFINKQQGDLVLVNAPSGVINYKILNVTTIHDILSGS